MVVTMVEEGGRWRCGDGVGGDGDGDADALQGSGRGQSPATDVTQSGNLRYSWCMRGTEVDRQHLEIVEARRNELLSGRSEAIDGEVTMRQGRARLRS